MSLICNLEGSLLNFEEQLALNIQGGYSHQIFVLLHSMFEYRHWEAEPIIS